MTRSFTHATLQVESNFLNIKKYSYVANVTSGKKTF